MNLLTIKDDIAAFVMTLGFSMAALGPIFLAIFIETTWPLGGIPMLVGFECSMLILLKLTAITTGMAVKADLERLRDVYDAESEPWDDVYPLAPVGKIRLASRIFQYMPLIYSGLSVTIQGAIKAWPLALVSVVIFVAAYRVVPKLVATLARSIMASDYVRDKLKYYGERGARY
jgi:hypothetical protein